MARPRKFDQDAVLDQATDVFWRYGYAGTSLEQIDRATGLKRGSLYNAFGDKRGLFLACLDHYGAREIGAGVDFLDQPGSVRDKVGGLFEGAAEAVAERGHRRGCLLCNSAVEVAPHDREVEARVVLHLGALRDAFERALLAEAGRYSAGEAARLADLLTANYMGLLVLAKAGFSLVHLRRVAAGAAALLEAADTGGIEKPGLSYHIQGLCHAAAERTIVGADGRSVMTDSNTLALTKSAAAGVAMLALVGCASTGGSDTYSEEELSRLESYKVVQVVSAEEVKLDPETSGLVGGGLGAASGGLIGSQVSGSGAVVIALAALGGIIGYAVEQQATDTVATRYVITVDGSQQVIVQKDSDEPLEPGDVAMLIGDYKPRLVKAPPDVVKSASENGSLGGVRVDEETGVIYFDQELEGEAASEPGGGSWHEPGSAAGEEAEGETSVYSSGSWAAPEPKDWPDEQSQQ